MHHSSTNEGGNPWAQLKHGLQASDIKRIQEVMPTFLRLTPKDQVNVLKENENSLSFTALICLIEQKTFSESVQRHLIERLKSKAQSRIEDLIAHIKDSHYRKKIIYIRVLAEIKAPEAIPLFKQMTKSESDILLLKELIKALSLTHSQACAKSIADFIYSGNEELKQEAIFGLAEIGGPDAVTYLKRAIKGNNRTDLLIIDALTEIDDPSAIRTLCSLVASPDVHIRNRVMDHLIEMGPTALTVMLSELFTVNEDVQIHYLTLFGRIRDKSSIPVILKLLYRHPKNPNIRFAAYEALEQMPSPKAAISLAVGLEDSVDQVRLAAARAINSNISPLLISGLANIITPDNSNLTSIVTAIIDAEADQIIKGLIDHETFLNTAINYIATKAHPKTKNYLCDLILNYGKPSLIRRIDPLLNPDPVKSDIRIYVIDDSKMMLRLYQKKLFKMGFDPILFEFPAQALEAAYKDKPHIVITDLNMPEINGIEVTQALRKMYTSEQLPIIMITTQSDFEGQKSSQAHLIIDDSTQERIGLDAVLHKPFDDEELLDLIHVLLAHFPASLSALA